ncbi:MAG: PAS domain-containing protein [Promethearchaeota archaeon]
MKSIDFQSMIHTLPMMVYRCKNDRNWTMEFVSKGCFCLTGRKPSDFVNNKRLAYADIIHPLHVDKVWEKVQYAINNHIAFHMIYIIITAEGAEKWVMEEGYGLYSKESRELIAIEGYITDISHQKAKELKLFDRVQSLEKQLKIQEI